MTATDRKRPRWLSVAKWIGLYLLAQIIGGFTVGFFFGGGTGRDALFSAAIFIAMIVYALAVNRRRQRGDSWRGVGAVVGGMLVAP